MHTTTPKLTIGRRLGALTLVAVGLLSVAGCAAENATAEPIASESATPAPTSTLSPANEVFVNGSGAVEELTLEVPEDLRKVAPQYFEPQAITSVEIEPFVLERPLPVIGEESWAKETHRSNCGVRMDLEWADGARERLREQSPVVEWYDSRGSGELAEGQRSLLAAMMLPVGDQKYPVEWSKPGYVRVANGVFMTEEMDSAVAFMECYDGPEDTAYINVADGPLMSFNFVEPDPVGKLASYPAAVMSLMVDTDGALHVSEAGVIGHRFQGGKWAAS